MSFFFWYQWLKKKLAVVEMLVWGHALVAVIERFQQESMYELSAGTKKEAVVEKWPGSGGLTVVIYVR